MCHSQKYFSFGLSVRTKSDTVFFWPCVYILAENGGVKAVFTAK